MKKEKKVYLHVGKRPSKGKKIGVPAHAIARMFIEMVRNLVAMWKTSYLKFPRCKYKLTSHIQKGRTRSWNIHPKTTRNLGPVHRKESILPRVPILTANLIFINEFLPSSDSLRDIAEQVTTDEPSEEKGGLCPWSQVWVVAVKVEFFWDWHLVEVKKLIGGTGSDLDKLCVNQWACDWLCAGDENIG